LQLFTNGQKARISGAPHKYFVVAHLGSAAARLRPSVSTVGPLHPGDLYVACGRSHPVLYSDYAVLSGDSVSWVAGCMPLELQAEFHVAQQSFHSNTYNDKDSSSQVDLTALDTESDYDSSMEFPYMVQHGHLETPVPCTISFRFHNDTPLTGFDIVLRMQRPEWAICPGQVAAIYKGRVCLGGGKVKSFGSVKLDIVN